MHRTTPLVRTSLERVRVALRGLSSRAGAVFGLAAAVSVSLTAAAPAHAQTIDQAVKAYNNDNYEDAAFLFADVVARSSNPDDRVQAEYYLGHSLYKAGYLLPAYQYYGEVFNQGPAHPKFLDATAGLLNVADALGDDVLIPEVINRGYAREFQNLSDDRLNTINYLIGMISQRRGNFAEASDFLKAVTPSAKEYLKARYLLGIMSLKVAQAQGETEYQETLDYFTEIEEALQGNIDPESPRAEEQKKLLRLALLGKARTYYSQGDYAKSVEYYEKVPRFSDDWYDAMFESGWAYRQNALDAETREAFSREIGKALGMTHSVQSPYFDSRYRAESFVLKATAYFDMCHFDRARKTLDDFFALYEPVAEALKPYLVGDQTDAEMVNLVVEGAEGFPEEIRLRIASNRRFQRFLGQVEEAREELVRARESFPDGSFKNELLALIQDQLDRRVALTGRLVREQLSDLASGLEFFLNQARIIKFETADAERKMLEAGKDITKGPRAKGPPPSIPSAQRQFWGFNGEYWIDELGYYQHSIKNECVEEIFQ
jgi:tetratricopeptide (TPR) repeat protein